MHGRIPMNSNRLVTGLLATLIATACISLPDIEPASHQSDGGLPDAGPIHPPDGDGGGSDGGTTAPPDGGDPGPTSIVLASPSSTVVTKDAVEVQVQLGGAAPAFVELLANNTLIAVLPPPFSYTWNTQGVPEGTYALQARAAATPGPIVSEARTIIVDRTPPQVTSRKPDPGANNVSVKAQIQVQFSEAVERASITDAAVTLMTGTTPLAKALSLSGDGITLTITPASPPPTSSQLTVTFSAEVMDAAQNSLLAPSSAWTWNVPEWLNTVPDGLGNAAATRPSLVLDAAGTLTVAWEENDIYLQRLGPTGWTALGGGLSASPNNTPATAVSLQARVSGDAVVAWSESDGTAANVYVQEWVTDHWQPIGSALSASGGSTNAAYPSLGLKTNGTPVVAWEESDGTASNIYVRQWLSGSWQQLGPALSAVTGATNARSPGLVFDSTGSPVVIWRETAGTADNLYVWRWTGTAWEALGAALSAYPGATNVQDSSIALDSAGNPVVAWTEEGSSGYDVHVARWTGSSWQTTGGAISSGSYTRFTNGLSLKLTAQGVPFLAWVPLIDDGQVMESRLELWRFVQGAWEHLLTTGNGEPSGVSLALDANGVPTLAWDDLGGAGHRIFVIRQNR
jgi:hypothetical protein